MAINWEAAISVVLSVVLRKSVHRFKEVGCIAMEFVSLFASAVQFSGIVYRRPEEVSASRHSGLPTMAIIYDMSMG